MNEDPFLVDRHDLDALKELMLSKFEEVEKSADARAIQVEKALNAARAAADRAVTEAKAAADLVSQTLTKRIEQLESGGAPFASRLDEGLTKLKKDVDVLNTTTVRIDGEDHKRLKHDVAELKTESVRTDALDSVKDESRRTRNAFYIAVGLLAIGFALNLVINLVQH